MKKQLQFLTVSFLLLAFSITAFAQTTRRVNGDPNITGVNVYNTIQAAVDAANTDDVILIEAWGLDPNATSSSYNEGVIVTKHLHFIGNGFNRDGNSISPFDKRDVVVAGFDFTSGSKGSSVKYLNITSFCVVKDENISITSSTLAITSIQINQGVTPNTQGTGLQLKKCNIGNVRVDLPNLSTTSIFDDALSADLLIENCILNYVGPSSLSLNYPVEGVTIINSNFQSNVAKLNNSTIVNTLFSAAYNSSLNFNVQISHSIAVQGGLPSLSNNLNNVSPADIWDNPGSFRGTLKVGSVAIGHGMNGEDIGEYGGSDPYEPSGLPSSPIATDIQNTQVGNDNINIQVQATYIAN